MCAANWMTISDVPGGNTTMKPKDCSQEAHQYRTIDGSCNNLDNPDWGRSFTEPKRLLQSEYSDGRGLPRTHGVKGTALKSPRLISAKLMTDVTAHASQLTVFHMGWGQYIDHDMTAFPVIKSNNTDIDCCEQNLPDTMLAKFGGPCFPVHIPSSDHFFRGRNCMSMVRSSPMMDEQNNPMEPREQINSITAYVDASTVYGSTPDFTNAFLDETTSLLEVGPNNMLPKNTKHNCKLVDENSPTDYCMAAGDGRANVFLGLGMFHTIFHRLHNNLVTRLGQLNPLWGAKKLFNEARKINAALHQHITYNEYIPTFLPTSTINQYGLKVGDYQGYKPNTNAQMSNAFSSAAFRFGHSQIQKFVKVNGVNIPLQDTLMRPFHLLKNGPEAICDGMSAEPAEDPDSHFSESVTNHMFEKDPIKKDGLDLVSINTQRGRDHGLAPFNKYRVMCGMEPIVDFVHDDFVNANILSQVYDDVNDIDLFIGGMTEKHVPGGLVGPTFACILGQQFKDLKYGDRFWYEKPESQQLHGEGFTAAQLADIKKQTMSSVICNATETVKIQERAMEMPSDGTRKNLKKLCTEYPKINLDLWKQ